MRLALELTALCLTIALCTLCGYERGKRETVPCPTECTKVYVPPQCLSPNDASIAMDLLNRERAAALLDLQRCRQQADEYRRLCEKTEDDDDQ